jgi:histidine decarboxylase
MKGTRALLLSTGKMKKQMVAERLQQLHKNVSERSQFHLGYPYNLNQNYGDIRPFMDFFLNNLGDAYAQSNYGINTQDLEREVVEKFLGMWGGNRQSEPLWGSVTSCGTEGNLLGILYGREKCEASGSPATLVSSVESHYSISKAGRMFRMPYERISSTTSDGEINYHEFEESCRRIHGEGGSICAVVNAGSTVVGGHDNMTKMIGCLDRAGVPADKRFIHVDAALSGLLLPLIPEAKDWHFGFDLGADSIAVSGHKQLGTPVPCGVMCAKREHMERWAAGTPAEADYVNTQDSTISGSRSGFAALALWYAIETQVFMQTDVQTFILTPTFMKTIYCL